MKVPWQLYCRLKMSSILPHLNSRSAVKICKRLHLDSFCHLCHLLIWEKEKKTVCGNAENIGGYCHKKQYCTIFVLSITGGICHPLNPRCPRPSPRRPIAGIMWSLIVDILITFILLTRLQIIFWSGQGSQEIEFHCFLCSTQSKI